LPSLIKGRPSPNNNKAKCIPGGTLRVLAGKNLTLDVKKSNSSNETPNVMTVGVENYGPSVKTQENRITKILIFNN
jgi:hypothetical protein